MKKNKTHNIITDMKHFILFFAIMHSVCSWDFRESNTSVFHRVPYYRNFVRKLRKPVPEKTGILQVSIEKSLNDPRMRPSLQKLVDIMNEYLKNQTMAQFMDSSNLKPLNDITVKIHARDENKKPNMGIYTLGPRKSWRNELRELCKSNNLENTIYMQIDIQDYWPHESNTFSPSLIVLGSGYQLTIPPLTLGRTMKVLHISGALINKNGKILRAGAEGIAAAIPESIPDSVILFRNYFNAEMIEKIISHKKRTDISGEPPAWQIALHNLLAGLMDHEELKIYR